MSHPEAVPEPRFEPRWPWLVAGIVFVLTTLSLTWPMLQGQFLLGDDQYVIGYAFRKFGAEYFRAQGSIPEWNPYIFGGLPFIAAQHGDIFYPTAWLRWMLPVDTAMNLGFALHLLIAGCCMYAFLRSLGLGWTAATVGGVAYQMTGIVASLVSPGHDGKLFVSALAPLALFALVRAVRDQRWWGYGLLALTIGLCMLSPHYQLTYYLLVAAGLWTLYLVFFDPDRPAGRRWPVPIGAAFGAVVLGVAIASIQVIPFLSYIPFSPRAAGGPSGGWEYAISYSLPIDELFTTILPQFNGVLEHYWGENALKAHTEYLGAVVVLLAVMAWGNGERRRLFWALTVIGGLFLLVAFGGHTPFYRLWYEVMPFMDKVRAPGMAFTFVALPVTAMAAMGAERLLKGDVLPRSVLIGSGILGVFAVLGVAGALEGVAQLMVEPGRASALALNAEPMRLGSLRLFIVVLVGGSVLWAVAAGRLRGALASLALIAVVAADLWSIDRLFFRYHPPAEVTYGSDPVISALQQAEGPFRVLDGRSVYGQLGSMLMAYDIRQVLGYHGNEVRFYDELMGGKNIWSNALNPNVWDLVAMRYLILSQVQELPGLHRVVGPVTAITGAPAVLYERDSVPPYVRVVPAAAKVPEEQIVPTLTDPRFPIDRIVLYPDSMSVSPAPIGGEVPEPAPVTARVAEWEPGRMRIALSGAAQDTTYLLISETWYPDWHAVVDDRAAPVLRGDMALLTIPLPPGAREIQLHFASDEYRTGQLVSLAALGMAAVLLTSSLWRRRRESNG